MPLKHVTHKYFTLITTSVHLHLGLEQMSLNKYTILFPIQQLTFRRMDGHRELFGQMVGAKAQFFSCSLYDIQ